MDPTILSLVGPITGEDLQYVDVYVGRSLGIFIPSVGHCGYALRQGHTHPSFSMALFPDADRDFLFHGAFPPGPEEYLAMAISPEVPHEETTGEEFVSYLAIMVGTDLLERVAAERPVPQCDGWRPFFVPKSVMPLLQAFMKETQNPDRGILLEALETAVAATLLRCLSGVGSGEGEKPAVSPSPGIQTALDCMEQHYSRKLTTAELAGRAAMSPGSFARAFRRETGRSPMQHLISIRLEKARKLLADSKLSVTETALRCGFHSPSHLTACFRKHYGMTPSELRSGRNLQKKD